MRRQKLGRGLATAVLVATVLSGCGSSDRGSARSSGSETTSSAASTVTTSPDPNAGPATTVAENGPSSATATAEGELAPPTATLPPEIDDELKEAWKPVDVVGERLPLFDNEADDDPAIGMQVPVLTGYDIDGNVIRIDPASQGKTMIVVLAHWCPHCNKEVPVINDLQANTALPSDLNVVGVLTSSDPKKPNWPPAEWIRSMDWKNPAMFDGLTTEVISGSEEIVPVSAWYYGAAGVPAMILVDDDGTVKARFGGEVPYDEMLKRINDALYAG